MINQEELHILSIPKMQEFFREKCGEWKLGDWFWNDRDQKAMPVDNYAVNLLNKGTRFTGETVDAIRLPLPVDPVNPARGLWGMIDWRKWKVVDSAQGNLRLWLKSMQPLFEVQDTPTLALLKAIAKQQEIDL